LKEKHTKKGHCEIKKRPFSFSFSSLCKENLPYFVVFSIRANRGVKVMAQFIISEEQIANRSKNPTIYDLSDE